MLLATLLATRLLATPVATSLLATSDTQYMQLHMYCYTYTREMHTASNNLLLC